MEAHDVADVTYLITVLALNGLGFVIVVVCYAQIYFSLGEETRHFNVGEMTIAKKMALLVCHNSLYDTYAITFFCLSYSVFKGLYKLCMLGTNRFLRIDSFSKLSSH